MDRDLDLFVLFSSRVGVMGNPGQANHATANAFLDQLAGHRRAMGLAGQAIAWGAWSEIGEAAEQKERIERQRSALGGRWFSPQQGLKAFEQLVRRDATTSVVMSMDWSVFEQAVDDRPLFLEELLSKDSDADDDSPSLKGDILTGLQETPPSERSDLLVSFLRTQVQSVLRLPSPPEPTVGFFDLGMDSLMAVELRNRLNRAFSGEYTVSNTMVFDYPNINSLAQHLLEELGDIEQTSPTPAPQGSPTPGPTVEPAEDDIAIVGMACRFPGARDLESFWQLLERGESAVTDGRGDDGPWSGVLGDPKADEPFLRRGGFVDGLEQFDAEFFGIAPIEARMMDPRQRLLLETCWRALEDGGLAPHKLKGRPIGVYVGMGGDEYRDLIARKGGEESYLGTTASVAAGRVAFALGLTGPAMPIDTACASSLAAIHQAVTGLRRGEVEMALVGGVSATLSPRVNKFLQELGMLSAKGRCAAFDADADGFVRGEGCGVIALKPLSRAEADNDRIWAVIRGSAVGQNGASAGLTVPNGPAQQQVIREALSRARLEAGGIDYLEAQGTGSPLGDPIEVKAAADVYAREREGDSPLLMGSVKANIGHLEWASGMAGLIKVVLSMQKGIIPRQLHFERPSPHIEWDRWPVQVVCENRPWPKRSRPPLAAISASGLSGTNAHLIVEGYRASPSENVQSPQPKTYPLPLSAKSDKALRRLAQHYLSWLEEGRIEGDRLADMAWTASMGRNHFAHRACLMFSDKESLLKQLRTLVEEGVSATSKQEGDDPVEKMAHSYREGTDETDDSFTQLFGDEKRHRISLPGHPFECQRHWVLH